MGKRKTKRKAPPKRKLQKLDKEFNCPVCFSDKTVEVHLNHKNGTATTLCRSCRNSYETNITGIDAEIDVYSAWVDAIEDGSAPGAQQSVLANDLIAIPQSSSPRQTRSAAHTGSVDKRQRTVHQESDDGLEEEEEEEPYLGEDDSEDEYRRRRPMREPELDNEIDLPEEEEEYDFGDNNEDDGPEEESPQAGEEEPSMPPSGDDLDEPQGWE